MNEMNEQCMRRLNPDQEQHIFARSVQSVDHCVGRLAHDHEHHSKSCINETNEQSMRRFTIDRI